MTGVDVTFMFFTYVIALAPLVIVYIFISIIMRWIKKLANIMSGQGW